LILKVEESIEVPFANQVVQYADRAEWVKNRCRGIGASEAAVVLGESSFKSRLELWGEKTGKIEPEDLSKSIPCRVGHALENEVLEIFCEKSGRDVIPWPQNAVVQHATEPFMFCTPDALQYRDGELGLVQAKTAGLQFSKEWDGDEPPLQYQIQVQHELACTGLSFASIPCLIGNQRFEYFDVERDEDLIDLIVAQNRAFWLLVEEGIEPDADGSKSSTRALTRLHEFENGDIVELGEEFASLDAERVEAKAAIALATQKLQAIDNRIKQAIGDNTYGQLPGGDFYTYKTQSREGYEVPPKSFRVLRRKSAG